ncbi:MAG: S1 family peptidase [Ignavibacteriaceae bacterium]
MKILFLKIAFIFSSIIMLNSCSSIYYLSTNKYSGEEKYVGIFPGRNDTKQLKEISNSIQRISSLALYEVYVFGDDSKLKVSDLNDETIKEKTVKKTGMDKSSSGTAIIIYSYNGKIGLLTCAHVIDFPDTIISYFSNESGRYTDKVESISFKKKQFVYIAGFPQGSEVNIVLMDKKSDLALLGQNYSVQHYLDFPMLTSPYGKAKELDAGSFVYVLGFPLNYKMVSQAIVSSPNYDKNGSFFIDAVINRGYSGGAVLAISSASASFELVGIVDWVAEENQNILEPPSIDENIVFNPLVPYKGDIFAKQIRVLKYGITKIISMEEIENFLLKNKKYFIDAGYQFPIYN